MTVDAVLIGFIWQTAAATITTAYLASYFIAYQLNYFAVKYLNAQTRSAYNDTDINCQHDQ